MIKRAEFATRKQLAEKIKKLFQDDYSGACEPTAEYANGLSDCGEMQYYLYYDADTGDIFENPDEAMEAYGVHNLNYLDVFTSICYVEHSENDFDIYRWENEGDRDYENFLSAIDDLVSQWQGEFGKLP